MKKNYLQKILFVAFIGMSVMHFSFKETLDNGHFKKYKGGDKSDNGSKVAYTQSAHDQTEPGTCVGCHNGGSVVPTVNVTFSPALEQDNMYTPGTTYTITYNATGYPAFGIDVEMNKGNTVTSMTSGSLAAGSNTKYTANPYNQGFPSNISHSSPVSSTSSATFTWHAPNTEDTVYLFSNVVGVNNNNNDSGDRETFYNKILYPKITSGAGIADVNNDFGLTIFPNPSADFLVIQSNEISNPVAIQIIDMHGKVIKTVAQIQVNKGGHKLNVTDLKAGNYQVKLINKGKIISKALIIE